ncbi:MAG: hypothetical protein ABID54_05160 [Pseudomonadota bacterium]
MLEDYPGNKDGTLTLMGSGEMTRPMVRVYREILDRIQEEPIRALFLDTPAGFQLNADLLSEKAKEYFQRHFRVKMEPVLFKDFSRATPFAVEDAAYKIRKAHFIFSGPGSPTYALKNWLGNPVGDAIRGSLYLGNHLVFASAASICVGRYSMPVYEIYKVGENPLWVEGLDLMGDLELDLAVIPHWNNTEGGNHDTRFCYIGESRLRVLEDQLPDSTAIVGVDEHTACIFDLARKRCSVKGTGRVVIRKKGRDKIFPNGATFGFDELGPARGRGTRAKDTPTDISTHKPLSVQMKELEREFLETLNGTEDITYAIRISREYLKQINKAKENGETADALLTAYETLAAMQIKMVLQAVEASKEQRNLAPSLIALLVTVRHELREKGKWELADKIREELGKFGVILEDDRNRTRWKIDAPEESGSVR